MQQTVAFGHGIPTTVAARKAPDMHVTYHRSISNGPLADDLWSLFDERFERFDSRTAFTQTVNREEFGWRIGAPSAHSVVLWDNERIIGFSSALRSLRNNPYFNEPFLNSRFPEHSERAAVHYSWCIAVDPDFETPTAYIQLVKAASVVSAVDKAVVLFDVCDLPQPLDQPVGLAQTLERIASSVADVRMTEIGVQRLFAIEYLTESREGARLPEIVYENQADEPAQVIDIRPTPIAAMDELDKRLARESVTGA